MQGLHQGLSGFEIDRFEDLVHPAIEPLNHPTGLRIKSRCEQMFDGMLLAGFVERVISKMFAKVFATLFESDR